MLKGPILFYIFIDHHFFDQDKTLFNQDSQMNKLSFRLFRYFVAISIAITFLCNVVKNNLVISWSGRDKMNCYSKKKNKLLNRHSIVSREVQCFFKRHENDARGAPYLLFHAISMTSHLDSLIQTIGTKFVHTLYLINKGHNFNAWQNCSLGLIWKVIKYPIKCI